MGVFKKFYGIRSNKSLFVKMIVTTLISSFILLIIPLIQKNIIDNIMLSNAAGKNIALFFGLSILLIILGFVESYLIILNQLRIQKSVSMSLLESLNYIPSNIIKTRGSGAFMNSVFGDAEQLSIMLAGNNYFSAIGSIITSLVILIITSRWSLSYPLIIISSYLIALGMIRLIDKKYIEAFEKSREEIFKLNPKALEFIENRRTIMSAASFNTYLKDLEESIDMRDEYFKKSMALQNFSKGMIDSVKNLALIFVFIASMYMLLSNKLEIGNFIAMVSYLPISFLPLYAYKDFNDNKNRAQMIYNRNEESYEARDSYILPKNKSLVIDNLTVSYDDKVIIKDFSLDVDKMYGIVGVSGEGKSTLLRLLLGDIKADKGEVRYGDIDISQINLGLRYSLYKLYFQENEIFDEDLIENIAMKKQAISANEFYKLRESYLNEFKLTRQAVRADDFSCLNYDLFYDILDLSKLDKKQKDDILKQNFQNITDEAIGILADLKVNKNYYIAEKRDEIIKDLSLESLGGRKLGQRGSNISGGEKNKISLARLLLLESDLPILIDEPFTSVDLISERDNLNALKSYTRGKKGFIISHKLDVLNDLADELIVIKDGSIEARGTHKDLMGSSKLYKDLYSEFTKRGQSIS